MAQELITMTNKELTRCEAIERLIRKEINGTETAKMLSLSVRQTKRIKARVIKEGSRGVIHKSRGRPGSRRTAKEKINGMEIIVKEKYFDFGPTFASEKLEENHRIKIGKEKLRQLMTEWGLWKPRSRKKNKEYRSWRPRKEYYGEMEQFDGSYHKWFEDRSPACCLLASIDDAAGKITKLKFVHWEGVIEAFVFWKEYLQTYGKPLSIYLDRHSTYKNSHKSMLDDPNVLTQFQRAMEKDLGIKIIHAYSPQAKGRAERLFGTLQDRLIKELRLAGISTIKEANEFAEEVFIPNHNSRFAVSASKKGNLHKDLTGIDKESMDKIFSIQTQRIVNNDFTIRHKGKWYQLLKDQPALVLRKDKVLMEERTDGKLFISLRNRYLNHILLPERPKKIKIRITALTRVETMRKPAIDHPWRTFVINPKKRYQISSSAEDAPQGAKEKVILNQRS